MNFKINTIKFFFLSCFLLINISISKAQMLEEVPNPAGFSCSFFSGGQDGDLFFEYVDFSYYATIFHYDGMDLIEVPLPPNNLFSFYSHEYNDNHYFIVFDNTFQQKLYEYDGMNATEIPVPAGFEMGNFVAEYNDLMYVTLFDINFNNVLYAYDGANLTEVPSPANSTFSNYVTTYDGLMYVAYQDANFDAVLYSYDGTNLVEIPTPANLQFPFFVAEKNDILYIAFQDFTFNSTLYTFENNTLTEVTNPPGFNFGFVLGEDDNDLYLNFWDPNFYSEIFSLNGTTLTQMPAPPGFQFPQYATSFEDQPYFAFFDNNTFQSFLFFWNGTTFEQVNQPAGFEYALYADTLNGIPYFGFFGPSFNISLTQLDAANNEIVIAGNPVGNWTLANYLTSADDKLFLSYNNNTFAQTLFMFDGTDFVEIPNPTNEQLGFFLVEDQGILYFRYDNSSSFQGTLYKLTPNGLPTSADNTVTTFIDIPYFFEVDDFDFSDLDGDDFEGILITEVEALGNLLNNGAHVYVGDHIDVADIPTITYFPNTGDEGAPYTYFKFKVFDGDDYSEEDYTMFINVVDPATSTFDVLLNANVKVFPNPTSERINLSIESKEDIDELRLFFYSSTGQLIEQQTFNNLGASFQHQLNVFDLPAGNYFLIGKTEKGDLRERVVIF